MLESQQLWSLQSQLPPEAIKAVAELELHLQRDQEQDDKVRALTATVSQLEDRLAALELALGDRAQVEGRLRVAAPQPGSARIGEPVLKTRPTKVARKAPAKGVASRRGVKGARLAGAQ